MAMPLGIETPKTCGASRTVGNVGIEARSTGAAQRVVKLRHRQVVLNIDLQSVSGTKPQCWTHQRLIVGAGVNAPSVVEHIFGANAAQSGLEETVL
jgi:hypothetical protein